DRQSIFRGKIDKLFVPLFLAANEVPLDFDKNIFATEGVDQKLCASFRALGSTGRRPVVCGGSPQIFFVRRAACAPQKCNHTFAEVAQVIPLYGAFAFRAAEMSLRQQLA